MPEYLGESFSDTIRNFGKVGASIVGKTKPNPEILGGGSKVWDLGNGRTKTIDPDGTTTWQLNGTLHNDQGPAVINPDGSIEYWYDGELSRDGGPAVLFGDHGEMWYSDGKLNRLDGPAVTFSNGGPAEYWIHGKQMSKEEFELASKSVKKSPQLEEDTVLSDFARRLKTAYTSLDDASNMIMAATTSATELGLGYIAEELQLYIDAASGIRSALYDISEEYGKK